MPICHTDNLLYVKVHFDAKWNFFLFVRLKRIFFSVAVINSLFAHPFLPSPQAATDGAVCLRKFY